MRLPFQDLSRSDIALAEPVSFNNAREGQYGGDNYNGTGYFNSNIHFAKVLNPEDEIQSSNIPGDSPNYKNAHHFAELFPPNTDNFDEHQNLAGNVQEDFWYRSHRAYAHNSRTLGIVLEDAGGTPIVRQSLAPNNYKEGIRKYGMKKNDKTGGTRAVVPANLI